MTVLGLGMTKEQYNEWRNHPATMFYRQFLKDRREALIQSATEAWLNGSPAFEKENQSDRGRITELFVIEDLSFEVIETFYQERDNGSETLADGPRGIPSGEVERG